MSKVAVLIAVVLFCRATPICLGAASDAETYAIENMVVYGRAQERLGMSHTASEGMVGYDDIRLPPLLRVGELVEAVPGMIATQHSGTGKANQYFLRGFNLDHGTDFAVHLDDMPLNLRTHGHGQGYLDLNVIIPELVQTTEFRKGPYHADVGDFSSAGSAEFTYYDRLPEPRLQVTLGEFGYQRGLAAASTDVAGGSLLIALDHTRYDGPWELDEDARLTRLYAAWSQQVGAAQARISVHSYDSEWNSTDQIPRRAVASGSIGTLGFIDPHLGGASSRHAITGKLTFDTFEVGAYATRMDFELFSNFTYFLEDPVNGDEFEQVDERNQYGLYLHGVQESRLWQQPLLFRYGATLHVDSDLELGLYQTAARERFGTIRADTVDQSALGAYLELEASPVENLRAILGLRFDRLDWDIAASRSANSGDGNDSLVSPNLNLAYRISDRIETYASWGRGFHSNDLRGAAINVDPVSGDPADRVDSFARSRGAELGVRFEQGETFNLTAVLFQLELDSELVFVGDAGGTEPNPASERTGLELAAFLQANNWLALNATYAYTDAEFDVPASEGVEIPGAVAETFVFGANAVLGNGFSGSVRVRYLGEAPLDEANTVRSDDSWLVNIGGVYRRGPLELRLDLFNLLDSDENDIAYFYESRLPGEPADGRSDIHFHPLEPRAVRATLAWRFQG